MGHVVGADHDHGQLRVLGQYPFDLFDQSRRFRTYDRSVDQLDRAARQCRQADRDPGRWRVGVGMDSPASAPSFDASSAPTPVERLSA